MLPKHTDLTGRFYGRLIAIKRIGTKHDCALWFLRCYCGNSVEATIGELRRARKPRVSCGHCLDVQKYPSEYITWRNMKLRCFDSKNKDYHNYGGRGITVDHRWQMDFLYFLEDMGLKDNEFLTLDRIDVNGNYEPNNCRWLYRSLQAGNKRNTIR